jgi:endonuclease I
MKVKDPLQSASGRVKKHLTEAAGNDGKVSEAELKEKLQDLAPTEAKAVQSHFDAAKGNGWLDSTGEVSLGDVEKSLNQSRAELEAAGATGQGLSEVEIGKLSSAGASMVGLARKLKGTRGAEMPPIPKEQFAGLKDQALMDAIRDHSGDHIELGYREARQALFSDIDNEGGKVRGVYTGREIATNRIPNAQGPEGMNTEHTRPKSKGVRDTAAVSDLHHLFPTDSHTNAKRSSYPFGNVQDVKWQKGDSKLGYDKAGNLVFEPPDEHKGDVARSQFYVSSVYGLEVPAHEESALRGWHRLDPVNADERQRNADISAFQENRNPFVDNPDLADQIKDF